VGSRRPVLFVVVALAAFFAFAPSLLNGFVNWDDNRMFLSNAHYRGLGPAQLHWMVTTTHMGHWVPLTWLTHGLDYVIWGMKPFGYHLTSLLGHAMAAGLLFLVADRLFAFAMPSSSLETRRIGAAVAALSWALHPLRAESVAWATERRDVLSLDLVLVSVLAYIRMAGSHGRGRLGWFGVSAGAFAAALLCKASAMTVPIVLILLDVWPLRRRGPDVFKEKIAYVSIGIAAAVVSLYALHTTWRVTNITRLSDRLAVAAHSTTFYLWKTVLPIDLSPLYQFPARLDVTEARWLVSAGIVIGVTLGALVVRRRWPAVTVAWIAYLVLLAPMSGFVHQGAQLAADRYAYLPSVALAVLAGGATTWVLSCSAGVAVRGAAACVTVLWLLAMATLAWGQAQIWRNTEMLWRAGVDADPSCALCHDQLGAELGNRGLTAEATQHFARAVMLRPDNVGHRRNLALALSKLGRHGQAADEFASVLAREPSDVGSRARLASALVALHRRAEARVHLEQALHDRTDDASVLETIGQVLVAFDRPNEAGRYFQSALMRDPNAVGARAGLAALDGQLDRGTSTRAPVPTNPPPIR
jgi:protein O-mannosyl-transferase